MQKQTSILRNAFRWLVPLLCVLAFSSVVRAEALDPPNGPIPSPFRVNTAVQVSCDHTGPFKVTIGTELKLTAKQAGELRDRACASVYGALVLLKVEIGKKNPLQELPFVAVAKVRGNHQNAQYDVINNRVDVGVGILDSNHYPFPVAVFTLGHELGHKLDDTYLKTTGVRVAAGGTGLAMGLNAFGYKRRITTRILGVVVAAAGAYFAMCPSGLYDGELAADRYGFAVLKALYMREEDEDAAARDAYRAAVALFTSANQAADEQCLFGENEKHEKVLANPHVHPSSAKRIANLDKLVSTQ